MNWLQRYGITDEQIQRNLARLRQEIAAMNAGQPLTCEQCFGRANRKISYVVLDGSTLEIDLEAANCFKVGGICQERGHKVTLNFLGDWAWY